jgi:hypothetical protein
MASTTVVTVAATDPSARPLRVLPPVVDGPARPVRERGLRPVADGPDRPTRRARVDPVRSDGPPKRRAASTGADRLTVVLVSLALFLGLIAFLADQLRGAYSGHHSPRVVVLRRVYETRIVQTIPGPGSGTSVSQSVSNSGSGYTASPAPTTSTSG